MHYCFQFWPSPLLLSYRSMKKQESLFASAELIHNSIHVFCPPCITYFVSRVLQEPPSAQQPSYFYFTGWIISSNSHTVINLPCFHCLLWCMWHCALTETNTDHMDFYKVMTRWPSAGQSSVFSVTVCVSYKCQLIHSPRGCTVLFLWYTYWRWINSCKF